MRGQNKFICACSHGIAISPFVLLIHQLPHVSTRSAYSDKTFSFILGWFILPLYGFFFFYFVFRNQSLKSSKCKHIRWLKKKKLNDYGQSNLKLLKF